MSTIDKIKSLLDDPAVDNVQLLDSEDGHLMTFHKSDLLWIDKEFVESMDSSSMRTNFHQWPEIEIGDTVMTKDGEGVLFRIWGASNHPYLVALNKSAKEYQRHEIALLKKAVN